jgi:hypothetical protein
MPRMQAAQVWQIEARSSGKVCCLPVLPVLPRAAR